ncbi:T6SS phospholipase effector Tle1-like catalytic domain-containing protein [Aspergillus homomorphus CBS 101889]|uniref:T6SS Phospholipase effector Tle1-like catalytic domain-containing protein n=1 Tax=Aspergillus homomorphus (strain CBS 101889) TaxID=1450537 RepID=A0A395HF61_ASPHC|nr:hypothetical protein BO97DRAFT_474186 [Aspergillus homomorphus CBS 101889]RAL06601.1 hypothetical protein BO97DRAFT_474186 [Aspergillus homomorphus CBS 101889]
MNIPSNIARISHFVHQIVYYDAGVSTGTSKKEDQSWVAITMAGVQKTWEGAFGRGLEENVCEGYNFLVKNWSPGDEIHIFDFSQGAYTSRALAGLICNMGICMPDMMDDWLSRMEIGSWSEVPKGATAGLKYEDRFYKDAPIEVIGVFDTVGALGLPNNTWYDVTSRNSEEHGFHDTDVHPQIKHAFHAVALDDNRAPFSPTLWHLPVRNTKTKLIQCWFPGCHIHIGGGSEQTAQHRGDLESMASLSLAWMVDRVREHTKLQFEPYELTRLYQTYINTILDLSQRFFKKSHDDEAGPNNRTGYGGWGMGSRPDSMTFGIKMTGTINRTPGQYKPIKKNDKNETVTLNPHHYSTEEYTHPVVAYALGKSYQEANQGPVLHYQPEALKDFTRVKSPTDPVTAGWDYLWRGSEPAAEPEVLLIPEVPLWEDTDDNLMSERDYMRADWLAFRGPRLWFPKPVRDHIDAHLAKHEDLQREVWLLLHLADKARSQLSSVWRKRSVAYKLRQKLPSTGNEENVKLMLETGVRTWEFLAMLDQGKLYPEMVYEGKRL